MVDIDVTGVCINIIYIMRTNGSRKGSRKAPQAASGLVTAKDPGNEVAGVAILQAVISSSIIVGWRVGAVLAVHFVASNRRREDTGKVHGLVSSQQVFVVLIENIDVARFDRPDLAIRQGFHLTFALDAKYRFVVMLVMNMSFGALIDTGDMEGKIPPIGGQHETGAVPGAALGLDQTVSLTRFLEIANDHRVSLPLTIDGPAVKQPADYTKR